MSPSKKSPAPLSKSPSVFQLAPVHEGHEEDARRQEQPAGEVVGQAESHQEGREQQVAVPPALAPEQQNADGRRHEQGVEGVDLRDDGLRPERRAQPEGEGAGGRGHDSFTE